MKCGRQRQAANLLQPAAGKLPPATEFAATGERGATSGDMGDHGDQDFTKSGVVFATTAVASCRKRCGDGPIRDERPSDDKANTLYLLPALKNPLNRSYAQSQTKQTSFLTSTT